VLLTSTIKAIIALITDAASISETLVNFYEATRRNNPEDSHLHTRYHEKLKSYQFYIFSSAFNTSI
jgi:hypothetical protein